MRFVGLLAVSALLSCSSDASTPAPRIDDFVLSDSVRADVEAAQKEGAGADGSYHYDEGSKALTLEFSTSSFRCDGPSQGMKVTATVKELSATTLTWEMEGDEETWTRVDSGGEGLVGVWAAEEEGGTFYLIITADGKVQVFGPEVCDDDRVRNGERCLQLGLSGAEIVLDGDLSDWEAVKPSATISDQQGDHFGDDPGADIRAMKVEIFGDSLFVLMQLYSAPSENFQAREPPNEGVYQLDVQHEQGMLVSARVAYSPEREAWEMIDPVGSDSGVAVAVAPDGLEWKVELRLLGDERISRIRVESIGGGAENPSGRLDEIDDCAFFPGF